jgi:dTMP kinase
MAIKSVTNANLADYVAEKRALGSDIASHEQAATAEAKVKETKGDGVVVGTTTETVSTAPEAPLASEAKPAEKKDRKNPVQDRIDELTREKKELDEFAAGEYEARLQAQRRIAELESQIKALEKDEQPKVERKPRPDRSKYQDAEKYENDLLEWNREQAIADFRAQEEERRRKEEEGRMVAEANARRDASLDAARQAFTDFDEVLQGAIRSVEMKRAEAPSKAVEGLLWESEYHAQILYHFAKNPEEVKRINAMRPAQAALAIGRLETQFAKAQPSGDAKPAPGAQAPTTTPVTSKAPAPMPSLTGASEGTIVTDLAQPMPYKDYKRRRLDELQRSRRH